MNLPGKRLLLGTAVAAAALGVGGLAYAAGNDSGPDQGYVTVEDDATPSPGTPSDGTPSQGAPSTGPQQGDGNGNKQWDGRDCPDKKGAPQSQPSQGGPSQGTPSQGEPSQGTPPQGTPSQGSPDQSSSEQSDVQGQA